MPPRHNHRSRFIWDLAALPAVRFVIRHRLFPYVFQLLFLVVLIGLIVIGLRTGLPDAGWARFFTFTNLTILTVWGFFWPSQILLTVLFGRLWCTVCPLELMSNLAYRIKQLLGIRHGLPLPSWLRSGALAVTAFSMMQVAVLLFFAHEIPFFTGITLLALVGGAFGIGLIFQEPRAFCHGFCPAMPLLNLYSRFSPFGLHHIRDDVCASCHDKPCVHPALRARMDNRSCPSFLPPFALTTAHNCTLCFQCVKVCPKNNIGFGLSWRNVITRVTAVVGLPLAVYIFIECGFVFQQLLAGRHCFLVKTVYPYFSQILTMLHALPLAETLMALVGLPTALALLYAVRRTLTLKTTLIALIPIALGGFIFIMTRLDYLTGILVLNTVWLLIGFPATLAGILFLIARWQGFRQHFATFLTLIAPYFLPVAAAGHIDKAILEINTRLPYFGYIMPEDPAGVQNAQRMASGALGELHSGVLPPVAVNILLIVILLSGFGITIHLITNRLSRELAIPAYLGTTLLAMIYLVLLLKVIAPDF